MFAEKGWQKHGATDDAICAEKCVDSVKKFAGSTGTIASSQSANLRKLHEKAPRFASNAFEFGDTATLVPSNEFQISIRAEAEVP